MKTRKVPMRMCVGCREMKEKKALLRIVRNAQGEISFDRIGKAPGRGAYICKSKDCLTKAVRQQQLDRALEAKIDEAVLSQLMEEVDADLSATRFTRCWASPCARGS